MEKSLKKLSVPYNYDFRGTMEILKKYNHFIKEIYFPINPEILGSGRGGMNHKYYDDITKSLISRSKELDIKTNLVINPIGFSEHYANDKKMIEILNYVDYLTNVLDVEYVTVTNPILAKRISEVARESKVVGSVNMFINSYEGIKKAIRMGVKEFYLDRDSNWNIDLIRNISETFKDIKLRIMLNEGCMPNCILRISHFDCVALMQSEETAADYKNYEAKHRTMGCQASYSNDLSLLLKTPVIRPEDMKYYDPYVETFKVVGRTSPTYINEIKIKAYGERIYKGDFGLLIDNMVAKRVLDGKNLIIPNESFPSDYMERKFKCNRFCGNCNYCPSIIKKIAIKKEA